MVAFIAAREVSWAPVLASAIEWNCHIPSFHCVVSVYSALASNRVSCTFMESWVTLKWRCFNEESIVHLRKLEKSCRALESKWCWGVLQRSARIKITIFSCTANDSVISSFAVRRSVPSGIEVHVSSLSRIYIRIELQSCSRTCSGPLCAILTLYGNVWANGVY